MKFTDRSDVNASRYKAITPDHFQKTGFGTTPKNYNFQMRYMCDTPMFFQSIYLIYIWYLILNCLPFNLIYYK
jgi:hypothetical protein